MFEYVTLIEELVGTNDVVVELVVVAVVTDSTSSYEL